MEVHKQKMSTLMGKSLVKQQHSGNKQLLMHKILSPCKNSRKNLLKSSSKLNMNSKCNLKVRSKKYLFNKTTLGTPYQKSTLLSYISTPKQRSFQYKLNKDIKKNAIKNHKQLRSTEEQNYSGANLQIYFIVQGQSTYSKYYANFINFATIRQQFANQWAIINNDKNKNKHNAYGMVGLTTLPYNHLCNSVVNSSQLTVQWFLDRGYQEINLTPNLITKSINYDQMSFKDFDIVSYLGSGGFSEVYLAKCLIDHQYCALKFIRKDTINSQKKVNMLENEKNILFSIYHPHLIDLYYAFQTQNYVVFGLQYCSNGNLYSYLNRVKTVSENDAKFIFLEILKGMQYLHQNNILFRDVKLENILFSSEGHIKITDFGLSKPNILGEEITYSYCGSPEYMAPEMLAKAGHSYQVDYYALGILLYELLQGQSPFYAKKKQQIFFSILNSEPKFPKSSSISKQAKSLIRGLLTKNPKHRIGSLSGIRQIVSHPWLRGFDISTPLGLCLPSSNDVIQIDSKQRKKLNRRFSLQKSMCQIKNVFLERNYVNKGLLQRIQELSIKFKQRQKLKMNTTMSQKKHRKKLELHFQ